MARRPPAPLTSDSERPSWWPIAAVVTVALLACVAGLGNELAQDDIYLIEQNVRVHDLSRVVELFRLPYWPPPFSPDLYRPLTSVLLALEYVAGGGTPFIFRLCSYALYVALSAQVLLLARTLLPERFAFGAALLFAAHPVHVEAAALAVSQSELMVGLLAVVMVRRYMDRRRAGGLAVRDWMVLAVCYLAACLFKEQGLVLPALLIAAEWLLVRPATGRRWSRLLPGFAAMAGVAVLVLIARHAVLGEIGGSFASEALVGVPLGGRVLTMLRVAVAWVRLLVWPAHLQLDYAPQEIVASQSFGVREIGGALLLIAGVATAWLLRRRAPAYAFAVAWVAIALAPVSNVVLVTAIVLAERTLLLPSVGFVLGVGALATLVSERIHEHPRAFMITRAMTVSCLLAVAAGIARSAERQRVWRNDAVLAVRTVQDAPLSFRAQRVFGDVALDLNQPQLALPAYARSLELAPEAQRWRVRNDIARTYRLRGESQTEAEYLRASLAQRPDQNDARGYLIAADVVLGRYDEAAQQADSAIAHGGSPTVFAGLRAVADSAARAAAPPGSVRVTINTGDFRRGP